jgi:pimeloyl-ACP methyl ester carboxylesterase
VPVTDRAGTAVPETADGIDVTPLAHTWLGARSGRVTLVLHGGGPGCHSLSDFGALLAHGRERRWLCLDLPGYGGSQRLDDRVASEDRLTALTGAVARQLEVLEVNEVDVLTQSFGGIVTVALVAERPELVGRIVLIGSQPTVAPGSACGLRRSPDLGAQARSEYYGGEGPTQAKMRQLMARLEWCDAEAIPEQTVLDRYRASITPVARGGERGAPSGSAMDVGDRLHEVRSPTLVVWGRHDPFGGPDYAAALADALPCGDLAVIGRTAHHPQAERPSLVAALASAFLGGDM